MKYILSGWLLLSGFLFLAHLFTVDEKKSNFIVLGLLFPVFTVPLILLFSVYPYAIYRNYSSPGITTAVYTKYIDDPTSGYGDLEYSFPVEGKPYEGQLKQIHTKKVADLLQNKSILVVYSALNPHINTVFFKSRFALSLTVIALSVLMLGVSLSYGASLLISHSGKAFVFSHVGLLIFFLVPIIAMAWGYDVMKQPVESNYLLIMGLLPLSAVWVTLATKLLLRTYINRFGAKAMGIVYEIVKIPSKYRITIYKKEFLLKFEDKNNQKHTRKIRRIDMPKYDRFKPGDKVEIAYLPRHPRISYCVQL